MSPFDQYLTAVTRRHFLSRATAGFGLGSIALAGLLDGDARAAGSAAAKDVQSPPGPLPAAPATPKRVT